jgi:YVTN family beta-propeller protein
MRCWLSLAVAALLGAGCPVASPATPDAPKFELVDRSTIGGGGGWDFITFDPRGERLFIARGDRVQVWSAREKRVVAEIPGTEGVHGIALAHDLNRGFTTNGRSNSVTVFALDDLRTIRTIAVPGRNPDAVVYDPSAQRLYSFNGASHDATVIDANSLQVVATIPLGGKPEVGVADGRGSVFVNVEDTAEIAVIDQASNVVKARWPLGSCKEPTGLAVDLARRRLFAACANHEMAILDAESGALVGRVPIGGQPDGAAFDPGLGVALASNGDGSLTLVRGVEGNHYATIATVPTQARARTLSLDPASHRVFLVTASFGPTPAATADQPRPRAPMVPDSFTVLVFAPR